MVKRKPGTLLPLEVSILAAALRLQGEGGDAVHGFAIAKHLTEHGDSRKLTAHGTLYKALGRLEAAGLLESTWEEPDVAADAGRPRRRLYTVTGAGAAKLAEAVAARSSAPAPRTRLAPS
jgi:PadR family transcriptional regulator, regulatory protein PadR